MGMGVVSDDDFLKEVNNSGLLPSHNEVLIPEVVNSNNSEKNQRSRLPVNPMASVVEINKGRGLNNVEVPESLRAMIGETAVMDGRAAALQLAESFGIKPSSVSAYSNGATSTASYDKPNGTIINTIQTSKDNIGKRARNKLRHALDKLTDDKLDSADAKDLSGIAKDMASISKAMESDNVNNVNGDNSQVKPSFVVFAPTFINENNYETVHAKDNY